MKRFFLFSYTYTHGTSRFGYGNIFGEFKSFPSQTFLKSQAMENIQEDDVIIVITGWTEFSTEEDYLWFIADE